MAHQRGRPLLSRAAHLFLGHSPALIDRSIGDGAAFPGTATFSLNFFEAGFLRLDNSLGNTVLATEWANQTLGSVSIAAPYEIRLTVLAGSSPAVSSDTVGVWLSMVGGVGGKRGWGTTRTILGSTNGSWLVEIRNATTLQVLTSATYTVTVSVASP